MAAEAAAQAASAAAGDAREHVIREPVALRELAQERDVAGERAARERVTRTEVRTRPDAALALQASRDLRRVGAHCLADGRQKLLPAQRFIEVALDSRVTPACGISGTAHATHQDHGYGQPEILPDPPRSL